MVYIQIFQHCKRPAKDTSHQYRRDNIGDISVGLHVRFPLYLRRLDLQTSRHRPVSDLQHITYKYQLLILALVKRHSGSAPDSHVGIHRRVSGSKKS